jgi:cobalt/nickel transport system ATP-binding protein
MTEIAIKMEDVRYVYPDGCVALDCVNLKILRKEKVAILGSNGAGKSTLLMLMNGLYTPSKGRVHVLGLPVNNKNLHTIRMKVGLVFQEPENQLFCPTVWEDVTFGPLNMGLSEEEVIRRAKDALKTVGLEGYEEKAPHHLSVGEKKKAAIAAVLAMKPEILVLDEPTANLDPKSKIELIDFLNGLHKDGNITLITATHDLDVVPTIAHRIYVLNKGRIIAEGSPKEVFSDPTLLNRANLELPIVARLFYLLNEQLNVHDVRPPPLTVEETLYEINLLIKRNKPDK